MNGAVTLEELAELVLDTSLFWSSKDEAANPGLKKLRTLAGLALEQPPA
jgi:hypothetical protein